MTQSNGPDVQGQADGLNSGDGKVRIPKLAWTIMWFVLLLVLANLSSEFLNYYWWNPLTYPDHTAKLSVASSEYRDADVMVAGSSYAVTGIASPILAQKLTDQMNQPIRVYNFGMRGVSSRIARVHMRAVFQYASPRLLIYPVHIDEFEYRDINRDEQLYKAFASPYDLFTVESLSFASDRNTKNVISGFFRSAQLPFQWSFQLARDYRRQRKKALDYGGWYKKYGQFPVGQSKVKRKMGMPPLEWKHLIAMHQMAVENRCQLVVVRMPYDSKSKRMRFTHKAMAQFTNELEQFCDKHYIAFINLQTSGLSLESADFAPDGRHPMWHGAEKLTQYLAPLLVESLVENSPDGSAGRSRTPDK